MLLFLENWIKRKKRKKKKKNKQTKKQTTTDQTKTTTTYSNPGLHNSPGTCSEWATGRAYIPCPTVTIVKWCHTVMKKVVAGITRKNEIEIEK